ncbi:MAG: hypothetical protein ABI082_01305 [Dokdonella sp.]
MSRQWVRSSASLPHAGASIQFMIDDRKVPMEGTYAGGVFRSRWCTYDVGCVNSWCASDDSPQVTATAASPAQGKASRTTANWLSALLARPRMAAGVPGDFRR